MRLSFNGDGDGFEFRLAIKWVAFNAFVHALPAVLITVVTVLIAVLTTPQLDQLRKLLGW